MPAPAGGEAPEIRHELPQCDPVASRPTTPGQPGPAIPDRWRIVQALGYEEQIRNPYEGHNPIKGDLPIWGEDWFFSVTAISDTIVEPRRFPVPVGIARPRARAARTSSSRPVDDHGDHAAH